MNVQTVRAWWHEHRRANGIPPAQRAHPPETKHAALRLVLEDGLTPTQAARQTGAHPAAIRKWAQHRLDELHQDQLQDLAIRSPPNTTNPSPTSPNASTSPSAHSSAGSTTTNTPNAANTAKTAKASGPQRDGSHEAHQHPAYTYGRIERGMREPPEEIATRIATTLGVSAEEFRASWLRARDRPPGTPA
ncbi:helix-turn-helix domain protein [Segniliparus rotundus DSM 44985]|uniref:Helix-turn-helix domain protein n=1 Tax=Segniliparus rotundus (strain ATCC BAA-972 / CDC 1076 / CIP 108378 / DSM 44985 / JCM 13578) TaxID=640132 RepID=D6ZF97_SEGRD|nr:transposase [Segniliparus rotundus]ADG97621.1 helix-turn-helix domain protein [Segniliparus rotundus DSM 44985]